MSDQHESQERGVSWEEVAYSNTIQNEALIRMLVAKGIMTRDEFLQEAQKVHEEYLEQQKREQEG